MKTKNKENKNELVLYKFISDLVILYRFHIFTTQKHMKCSTGVCSCGNWRTIMSYGDYCNHCTRIQYCSNPFVTYSGISMGNTTQANNSRVLNEETARLTEFRFAPDIINYTYNVYNKKIHNVVAKTKITNSNIVMSGGELNLNTNNEIVLSEGFEVKLGGAFSANTGIDICN